MEKKVTKKKTSKRHIIDDLPEPTKLNKFGEWAKANPGGWFVINDMKAVMK